MGKYIFGVFFAPFPEEEISDYITHGPIIRVFTVHLESGFGRLERISKFACANF